MHDACVACRTPFEDPDTFRCPLCNKIQPSHVEEVINAPSLDEVEASDVDRLNIKDFGFSWGGGIARTSVTLIGGSPGAGKSTLMLQLAGLILNNLESKEETVLYIHSEEEPGQIKGRADRLEIPELNRIRLFSVFGGEVDILPALLEIAPCCVILDSLSGFAGEDNAKALMTCKMLKDFASQALCPALIIDHITKEDAFAGRMTLQHAVDTLITFYQNEDARTDLRVLKTVKNRFGPAVIQMMLTMTEKGLKIVEHKEKTKKPRKEQE